MKKTLAILLILVMLLPMVLVSNAEEANVETKPFYFVNWSGIPEGFTCEGNNIYGMPFFYTNKNATTADKPLVVSSLGTADPIQLAKNLKELFDTYPDGARFVNYASLSRTFHPLADEYIFFDDAVRLQQEWLDKFLKEYKRIGGKLDGLIVDLEYIYGGTYYISDAYEKDFDLFNRIVNHPKYQTEVRPLLEERGFKFHPNPNEYTTEIYGIYDKSGDQYAQSRAIWNAVNKIRLNNYITEAVYEPLIKYYPDASVSDYQSHVTYSWLKTPGGSGEVSTGGNSANAGNTANLQTYAVLPQKTFFVSAKGEPVYNKLPGFNDAVYKESPFGMFLWDANRFKNTQAAANGGNMDGWITYYSYSAENEKSSSCTPYYAETILHMGMMDMDPFLGYIVPGETGSDEEYNKSLLIVSDILSELTRVVGAADRKPIYIPANWNNDYVLSGMYAGGKNIWRITPDTTAGMTLDAFKVEGENPTFSISGQTVTFPQGKIIADGKVREVGTCGYWVETPKDVYPVITSLTNRYSEYPAFMENYEDYAPDTVLDYANALPLMCWDMSKKKGSTATVVTDKNDAENQVLALQGTYSLTNVKLPENITAGDTYAKNQAWEVTVTLPAGMGADGEVILLNCNVGNESDGGFKIAGGKVWYAEAGEYKEIAKLDVSGGGKFTFQRVVDFNGKKEVTAEDGTVTTEPAFTSDYYIYDINGALVGKAEKVPMAITKTPVVGIGLSCKNITGEAVLLDNYKLYVTGVAADFELYDAATGMKVDNLEEARERDTAYRLSWMNATDTEKVYSVVAAYYDAEGKLVSEQVIEQLKMAPGTDGVASQIVKNETDGQKLLVYLRDDNAEEKGPAMWIILAIAAGVVLAVAIVVIVIVVAAKKKKTTAPKENEKE